MMNITNMMIEQSEVLGKLLMKLDKYKCGGRRRVRST